MLRTRTVLVACLLLLAPACGDEQPTEPVAVRMQFEFDVDGAMKSGRLPPDTNREAFLSASVAVVRNRVRKLGVEGVRLNALADGGFEVLFAEAAREHVDTVRKVISQLGTLDFRIQVLPEPNRHEFAKRQSAWAGTVEEFQSWKKKEYARWKLLAASESAYGPGDGAYYLVKRQGRDGSNIEDFVVCEAPKAPQRFDGRILANPRVGTSPMINAPTVLFDIRPSFREAFGAWTERNVGLPMAIILNEEFVGGKRAPMIQAKLTNNVQITLGSLPEDEAAAEAKALVTVLQTGALRVRPTLVSMRDMAASKK